MAVLYKYRVWCVTENTHVPTASFQASPPTTCPNNVAHTITASKTAVIDSDLSLEGHSEDTSNPHEVTSTQSGSISYGGGGVTLKDDSSPFIKNNSSSYSVVSSFRFGGSTQDGTPSTVKIVVMTNDNSIVGAIRVYDVTNSLVIAEDTNVTFTSDDVSEIKSLSVTGGNVPANEAIFELQAKKVSGGGELRFQEYTLQF